MKRKVSKRRRCKKKVSRKRAKNASRATDVYEVIKKHEKAWEKLSD